MPVVLVPSPLPQLWSLAVQVVHIYTVSNNSCGMRTGNEASASKVYHMLTRKETHDSLVGDDGA